MTIEFKKIVKKKGSTLEHCFEQVKLSLKLSPVLHDSHFESSSWRQNKYSLTWFEIPIFILGIMVKVTCPREGVISARVLTLAPFVEVEWKLSITLESGP
jgi:hypothetical protein